MPDNIKAPVNQAVSAYNKTLNNNKNIIASAKANASVQSNNILRAGDVIDVVSNKSQNSFPNIVNEILSPQIKKIQEGEIATKKAVQSKEDLVEVMAAVNSAQSALEVVISVRDKFVEAYKSVLDMPL